MTSIVCCFSQSNGSRRWGQCNAAGGAFGDTGADRLWGDGSLLRAEGEGAMADEAINGGEAGGDSTSEQGGCVCT